MYSVLVPLSLHHSLITFAMNALPLSLRIFSGAPRIAVSSSSTIITSCDFNLRETSSAIFSRVYSSSTTNILIGLPSAVRSKIKSRPHTSFLRVDCLRRIPDSADPILRFFLRICCTFRPSSRQTCRSGLCVLNKFSSLHASMLTNDATRAALRDREENGDVLDGPTP